MAGMDIPVPPYFVKALGKNRFLAANDAICGVKCTCGLYGER